MGKFQLPVIETKELCGLHFTIRAVPFSVARLSQTIEADPDRLTDFLEAVWNRCVEVGEGEEKPAFEDMPLGVLNQIVEIASSTNADFPKPSSRSGLDG